MQYGLTILAIGKYPFLEITEEEFDSLKIGRSRIFGAKAIEEKFGLVMENFAEFELELLEQSFLYTVFQGQTHADLQSIRLTLNRRLANFLTGAKTYLDHLPQMLGEIFGPKDSRFELVHKEIAQRYDDSLGYRVMEALRNHVQHRDFPIHGTSFSTHLVGEPPDHKVRQVIELYVMPEHLREDKKFKKSVLQELEDMGEKCEIRSMVREYVEGLSVIHTRVRELCDQEISTSKTKLRTAIDRFRAAGHGDQSIVGLGTVAKREDGTWAERFPFVPDQIDYLEFLQRKNKNLTNLPRLYVSNEIL